MSAITDLGKRGENGKQSQHSHRQDFKIQICKCLCQLPFLGCVVILEKKIYFPFFCISVGGWLSGGGVVMVSCVGFFPLYLPVYYKYCESGSEP